MERRNQKSEDMPDIPTNISFIWKELNQFSVVIEKLGNKMDAGFNDLRGFYINRNEFDMYKKSVDDLAEHVKDKEKEIPLTTKIVYGAVTLIIVAFMGFLINLAFNK
jgi:hypothetical protein